MNKAVSMSLNKDKVITTVYAKDPLRAVSRLKEIAAKTEINK